MDGPSLWKELHTNALNCKNTNDWRFLSAFGRKVKAATVDKAKKCNCASFWDTYVVQHPPTYYPPEAYFEWTVNAHNAVNRKLGKREYSVAEARAIWSR